MLASTISATLQGIDAIQVTVEANGGERGEPRCVLVGLPDASVKESMDRVFSSLSNSGFDHPRTKVTINLAPGDLKKEGASFDLPIALALLSATGNFDGATMSDFLIAGELGLSGEVRKIRGALAMAILARKNGMKGIVLPRDSAFQACLVEGLSVYPVDSLSEAVDFLSGRLDIRPLDRMLSPYAADLNQSFPVDFSEVKGQMNLKRAVEIAVAGGHNLLMVGPPGSGKSMVAKRIPTILPRPSLDEYLEILNVFSIGDLTASFLENGMMRPIRSPHHTISDVGLLGGGTIPGPGEVSLAHNGILFMDELPEFKRSALEVLRQPLEDGFVTISRSAGKVTLPCRFMLVAAMNPCPCGFLGDESNKCRCSIPQIERYRSKISGPLLDRIDIHVDAPAVQLEELSKKAEGESSNCIRSRVDRSRLIQADRFRGHKYKTNSELPDNALSKHCMLSEENMNFLVQSMEQLSLSARAFGRVLKVSRTIADLDGRKDIEKQDLLEAIQYRSLDRFLK